MEERRCAVGIFSYFRLCSVSLSTRYIIRKNNKTKKINIEASNRRLKTNSLKVPSSLQTTLILINNLETDLLHMCVPLCVRVSVCLLICVRLSGGDAQLSKWKVSFECFLRRNFSVGANMLRLLFAGN